MISDTVPHRAKAAKGSGDRKGIGSTKQELLRCLLESLQQIPEQPVKIRGHLLTNTENSYHGLISPDTVVTNAAYISALMAWRRTPSITTTLKFRSV